MPKSFKEIFDAHISLLEQSTRNQYNYERDKLDRYLRKINKQHFELDEIDALNWAKWRLNMPGHTSRFQKGKKQKIANYTAFNAAIRWRFLWRRAQDQGIVNVNPWQAVMDGLQRKSRPCQKRPTLAMSDEEIKRLFNFCDLKTKNGVKDHAFFTLILGGALRLNEAAKVLLEHVIIENGVVSVILPKTKSGHLQMQQLPRWCNESIERMIKQRLEENAKGSEPLFISYRGKYETIHNQQYSHEAWHKRWESYREKLGLSPDYTIHSCRASACTKLLELGIDRKKVQDFMRHASLRMIEIYDKRRFFGKNHASNELNYNLM